MVDGYPRRPFRCAYAPCSDRQLQSLKLDLRERMIKLHGTPWPRHKEMIQTGYLIPSEACPLPLAAPVSALVTEHWRMRTLTLLPDLGLLMEMSSST